MMNKVIKTIDEHNIDRDAMVLFAFDLEGSEYVSYKISRDEEQDNLFVSKVVKNIDNTYNMVNIEDTNERTKMNGVVMSLVENAVKDGADKVASNTVTLNGDKVVKFINVNFNKEQKIEVRKTYVTTVKKEVSKVTEDYYNVEVVPVVEEPVLNVFPTITPEPVVAVQSASPVVAPLEMPVLETPTVNVEPVVLPESPVAPVMPEVVMPVTPVVTPEAVVTPTPAVVEPITIPTPDPVVVPAPVTSVEPTPVTPVVAPQPAVVEPIPVVPPVVPVVEPVPATPVVEESTPLVFNASKETNLNAALGEVASNTTISVENITPVREFGVDAPVATSEPVVQSVAPMEQPVSEQSAPKVLTRKAGFANSKFFVVVAVAFFLASCIFLGYEIYQYFQVAAK